MSGGGQPVRPVTIYDKTVTNAKLADMAASRVKARKTAGSGSPEDCTLSEILDFIGSAAQGDILFRGASGWQRLAAGTAGFMLRTAGAGADPAWSQIALVGGQYLYLRGDATTDGSVRLSSQTAGELLFERRTSGNWVEIGKMS
jgi:hypothetical protein